MSEIFMPHPICPDCRAEILGDGRCPKCTRQIVQFSDIRAAEALLALDTKVVDMNNKVRAVLDRVEDLRLAWALTPEAWQEEKYASLLKAFTELWKAVAQYKGIEEG